MRVMLIKPSSLSDHIQPSLGLAYLATALRRDHEVDIYDCIKEGASPEQVPVVVEAYQADLVGIQCYTFDSPKVKQLLNLIKRRCPNTVTVVGGAHVTANAEAAMRDFGPDCDFGFAGEGEIEFPKMVSAIERGDQSFPDILGAVWRDGDRIISNKPAIIHELDSIDMPALDLMRPDTYPEAQQGAFYRKFPIGPLVTTRGCPFNCKFCAAPLLAGKRLRHHSVEYIRRLVALMYHRYGVREFHFLDDNFTMDIDYAKSVLRSLIDMRLDISLAMPNGIRMDRVDDELLELMKQAGVYIVSVAVENGNDHILKAMHKSTTIDAIRENVARIRKHKLDVAGFFIVGYPGETIQTIKNTLRFARELDIQRAQFMTFVPLPGTAAFAELVANGEIKDVAWEDAHFAQAPYSPRGVSRHDLLKLKRRGFLAFYLRPKVFIRHLMAIKSYRHFKFLLARFNRWILLQPTRRVEHITWLGQALRLLAAAKRVVLGVRPPRTVGMPAPDALR